MQNTKLEAAFEELRNLNSIEDTVKDIELVVKVFTELIQEFYSDNIDVKGNRIFIETLSMKIILASKSILTLLKGFTLNTTQNEGNSILIDFSSVNIITRSIIEAFLTLEYLYSENIEENEKHFRFKIWQISGYKSRRQFFEFYEKGDAAIDEKLSSELIKIKKLLNEVKKSPYYAQLNRKELWKLDNYGLPRLISWNKLISISSLSTTFFSVPYKLYSNYAHSEYISLIQMNEKNAINKGSSSNDLLIRNSLRVVKFINCSAIIFLTKNFTSINEKYQKMDLKIKGKIELGNHFARNAK